MNSQALSFASPEQPHVAIQTPPRCLQCGERTGIGFTLPSNENGNGYRPYYTCSRCGRFSCFGDMRGVLAENPTCFCNDGMQFSRRVISGAEGRRAGIPRSIFYHCATGGCHFFEYMTNDWGEILIYSGPATRRELIFEGF
ncbi:uncharacterized protein BO97DRAFT_22238 [Aspergillus homomorphus CBS 101889]|uniref:GRF-like zinc ribbon domain-containing protein n=1 Tax=Aspergillus homomorphus (strain CBS 101889) TaxID=1450537 RepID=A0A395HG75_ASPHC|nr:hypothetical protein BO97DRAFT_22238 [Aspergillus homomorphus CBS 101889]RAL06636.1 hypothetical protein BO97DRAFT_22238 [Aspergillus homomorphus CBS 101889]